MNKVPKVKLSLRKLLTAMLAIGPVAILPSPVWAVLPTQATLSAQNGSFTVVSSGTTATIQSSDRAVIQWLGTNTGAVGELNIAAGEAYNFQMPAGGAVLNRVGTTGGIASIAGQLDSNGKVFILAPGGTITMAGTASVTTSGGLFLSTLAEENGAFLATGDLLYVPGASNGAITVAGTVAGSVKAVGGAITSAGGSVTGDMILSAVSNGALNLAASSGLSVGGNLTVTTSNGSITQTNSLTVGNNSGNVTGPQVAWFATGTANNTITLSNSANNFQNLKVGTSGTAGDVTVVESNVVNLNASSIGGALSVTAVGDSNISNTAISNDGTLTIGGNAVFVTNNTSANSRNDVNISNNSTIAGTLSGSTQGNSAFIFSGLGNLTTGVITAGNNSSKGNRSLVQITTNGTLTIGASISTVGNNANSAAITLTGGVVNHTAGTIASGNGTSTGNGGSITLNATTGNLTVGNVDATRAITLTAGAGSIAQAAGTTLNTRTSNAATQITAAGSAILDNANTILSSSTVGVRINANTANLTNAGTNLGTTTVAGNLTLTSQAGAINLGVSPGTSAEHVTVGGVLKATTTAADITDNNYSRFEIAGGLDLTTGGGNVVLDAASANGVISPRVVYGVVNANAGAGSVTVSETTPLNLGNITAASLVAGSTAEGIVDSGNLTVGGQVTLSGTNNSTITLDSTGHSVGTFVIGGNVQANLLLNSDVTVGTAGAGLTGNLSVTTASGKNIVVNASSVTGGLSLTSGGTLDFANGTVTTVTGNLSTSSQGATTQTGVGGLTVTGTTSVAAANSAAVTLGQSVNDFSSVVLNSSSGAVSINDANNLTVSGSAGGALTAVAGNGAVANTWNLVLGNLNVGGIEAHAQNGGGGNSGTITQQSGTSIHSEGTSKFVTNSANIVLGNAGNSFGRVEVGNGGTGVGAAIGTSTAGAAYTTTIVEDGTLRLGNLAVRGSTNLTSRTGSIIEDPDASVRFTNNGTLTLNAVSGSVLIGNTTTRNAGTFTGGNIVTANINAPTGAAAVLSSSNLTLGTTNVNSLTATATGGNLTQSGSGLKVFGSATFSSTRNITLTNVNNNFGRISLTTSNSTDGNIQITESGTLNLGKVDMPNATSSNFVATSVNGDIIDTGLGGVKLGGNSTTAGTGTVTLSAANGNIVLDDPTTDFHTSGGVIFNGKNVTLSPLGSGGAAGTVVLGAVGATSTAETLTVTSAIGNIASAGNITVTGDAMFQSGNGNITLAQSGNKFGTLKFTGNQVAIVESDDTALVTGSSALGSAQLSSGGNITVANRGGTINFNSSVFMSATGSITLPKLLQAVGTLTVNAAGTKDLSALSKSGDLNGKEPTNLGTGTYVPPGQ